MRSLIVVVMLWLVGSSTASAQRGDSSSVDMRAFMTYEIEKKDKGLAVLCWFVLPGGGYFYAGETGTGVAYLALDAVLFTWARDDENRTIPIIGLVASRLFELIGTVHTIDEHNWALRQRLKLAADIRRGSPSLTLTLQF